MSHFFGAFTKRGTLLPVCASCGGTSGTIETHRCIRFDETLADDLLATNLQLLRQQLAKEPWKAHKAAPEMR